MGDYVQSKRAARVVGEILGTLESRMGNRNNGGTMEDLGLEGQDGVERRARIRARTARSG